MPVLSRPEMGCLGWERRREEFLLQSGLEPPPVYCCHFTNCCICEAGSADRTHGYAVAFVTNTQYVLRRSVGGQYSGQNVVPAGKCKTSSPAMGPTEPLIQKNASGRFPGGKVAGA